MDVFAESGGRPEAETWEDRRTEPQSLERLGPSQQTSKCGIQNQSNLTRFLRRRWWQPTSSLPSLNPNLLAERDTWSSEHPDFKLWFWNLTQWFLGPYSFLECNAVITSLHSSSALTWNFPSHSTVKLGNWRLPRLDPGGNFYCWQHLSCCFSERRWNAACCWFVTLHMVSNDLYYI